MKKQTEDSVMTQSSKKPLFKKKEEQPPYYKSQAKTAMLNSKQEKQYAKKENAIAKSYDKKARSTSSDSMFSEMSRQASIHRGQSYSAKSNAMDMKQMAKMNKAKARKQK